MYKGVRRFISDNIYVFLGILIGIYISSNFKNDLTNSCEVNNNNQKVNLRTAQQIINSSINKLAPKPPITPKNNIKKSKLIRPRYYSTELGIREKLFVGIFTSEQKVNTQALYVNQTIGHLVDRIKFFITAQYKLKTKFNLTGLVGFTDARNKYRPFQVIKYVFDTYGQDFDYFFFANDYSYINAHKLRDVVQKISVSMDVYLGTRVYEGSYCNLDAGIVISNSVLKAMRNHLDWCIMNAVSEDQSENIGRCVYHSLGLSCQEDIQNQNLPSFKLKHFDLKAHLLELSKREDFDKAITVYPILQKSDMFLLNAYFLKKRLEHLHNNIEQLSQPLATNAENEWPPGQKPSAKPATRFDLPHQLYFNMSHAFFPDDFTNIRQHTEAELKDIENVLREVQAQISVKNAKNLQYRRLINGYRKFDLSRGMDYVLDLGFRDTNSGKEIVKRFEVAKPLGNVDFISVPYVTENARVNIILPIQETEINEAMSFLSLYVSNIIDSKEKTFLMLAFFYQFNSNSKGSDDVFGDIKLFVTKATSKYKNEDTKIAWVSIRLPESPTKILLDDNKSLNFAVVDLALKKIGLESLVLVLDVYAVITVDFLNRVRMNTISGFQVFCPIPFRQYNPQVSQYHQMDVNKNSGHFDREEYKYLSFHGKDYVQARKKFQFTVPLIRIDNDIPNILRDDIKDIGNIFKMFIKYGDKNIHYMRATEMNLKVKYHDNKDPEKVNTFMGNEAQLAKLLLSKSKLIPELKDD